MPSADRRRWRILRTNRARSTRCLRYRRFRFRRRSVDRPRPPIPAPRCCTNESTRPAHGWPLPRIQNPALRRRHGRAIRWPKSDPGRSPPPSASHARHPASSRRYRRAGPETRAIRRVRAPPIRTVWTRSCGDLHPDRRVIARTFPSARAAIDANAGDRCTQRFADQYQINANTLIAPKRGGAVIPP